jgi:putative acetyltransferase
MPVIKPGDFDDDRVKALLTRHLESMHANSPPGHVFALDWSGLQKPEISFYALWEREDLLGFGALKELEPRAGEIKSMRTADAHLRKGVAAAILDHIIAEARLRAYWRLSLETVPARLSSPRSTSIVSTASSTESLSAATKKVSSISSSILTWRHSQRTPIGL